MERAVATCGTALAEEHVKLLKGFASKVVLAFDADGAGQSAAGRFYEWERRLEIDVAVAALPEGSDPGELARSDPEALRAAIAGAKPFLQFRLERILDAADLTTPEGRARAADAAWPRWPSTRTTWSGTSTSCRWPSGAGSIRCSLRDRLEQLRREGPRSRRGQRLRRLGPGARRRPPTSGCATPRTAIGTTTASRAAGSARRPRPAATGQGRPSGRASSGPGLEALRLAIHRPDDVGDRLQACLFRDGLQRAAFQALVTPTTCTRPSTGRHPRCGPCWCG